MTLSEIRTQFIEITGRVDLSSDIINTYINSGQKLLDKLLGVSLSNPSYPMDDDNDENFWSEEYPLTLVHAACYYLEASYRNTEGMKDWLVTIGRDIAELDHDNAEMDSEGITRMEG